MNPHNNVTNKFLSDFKLMNPEKNKISEQSNIRSDARIKEVLGKSDNLEDLDVLNNIEIVDYNYIDKLENGESKQKKVLGQQVRDVFPQVVSITKDVVPDVYRKAERIKYEGQVLTIDLSQHGLKLGENIQLLFDKGEEIVKIIGVSDDNFTVRTEVKEAEWVFVFGREVNDFHTIDYHGIAMLNVSATQALSKKIENLQIDNKRKDLKIRDLTNRLEKLELLVGEILDAHHNGKHVSD